MAGFETSLPTPSSCTICPVYNTISVHVDTLILGIYCFVKLVKVQHSCWGFNCCEKWYESFLFTIHEVTTFSCAPPKSSILFKLTIKKNHTLISPKHQINLYRPLLLLPWTVFLLLYRSHSSSFAT